MIYSMIMALLRIFSLFLRTVTFVLLFTLLLWDLATSLDPRPLCTPQNLNLADISLNGSWTLLPDGTFRLEMAHCRLRRFSHTQVKHCLKGVHLVFMGDSLSRYFYLSLAHLLARKSWAPKFARLPAHPSLQNSILSERDFKPKWSEFYRASNKLLSNNKDSFEVCDCFRDDSQPWYKDGGGHQQESCSENRHFRFVPNGFLNDTHRDVRLSYIQWYGDMPLRGHKSLSILPRDSSLPDYLARQSRKYCSNDDTIVPYSGACALKRRKEARWDMPSFSERVLCQPGYEIGGIGNAESVRCRMFERDVLGPMGTTHLLLNIGWHSSLSQNPDEGRGEWFLDKVVHAADEYFASYPTSRPAAHAQNSSISSHKLHGHMVLPKVTWRSTTARGPFHYDSDPVAWKYRNTHGPHRLEYFDVWGITEFLQNIHDAIVSKDDAKLSQLLLKSTLWPGSQSVNTSTVLTIWVDPAHPEPWVYEEIHSAFLSAVCPIASRKS